MILYCKKKWQQNNGKLLHFIQENIEDVKEFNYDYFIQLCCDVILNGIDAFSRRSSSKGNAEWNTKSITQLCSNGGNCSMNFYLIPRNTFDKTPTESDCLITFAYKDTPRDTLKNLQKKYSHTENVDTKDYLNLCYELIERMVCPYNAGLS